jgi:diguanylate cyclase (GGDEF)-like protein/PAS domain S-box-containing protein
MRGSCPEAQRRSLAEALALALDPYRGLEPEQAARLRAQQIDSVFRLTPFMMAANILVAGLIAFTFQGAEHALPLMGWAIVFIGMCALGLWRWHSRSRSPSPRQASARAVRRVMRQALVPALFWASVPLLLYGDATPEQRLMIVSLVTGTICVGLFGLCSLPRVAVAYSSIIVLACIAAMGFSGDPLILEVTALLAVYIGCAWLSVGWFAALLVDRFHNGLGLERQGELIGLLLHDFEQSASDWLWETDPDGVIRDASARFAEVTDLPRGDLNGRAFVSLLARDGDEAKADQLADLMTRREPFGSLIAPIQLSSDLRWWSITGKPVFRPDGSFSGYRGACSDVTDSKRAEVKIRFLAHHDALTGLPNRTTFQQELARGLARPEGEAGLAVLLIDLDDFKGVNDTLGHGAGDTLLLQVARRLHGATPRGSTLARLGGDEFGLLADVGGVPEASALADGLIEALARPFDLIGQRTTIGASVGIALAGRDGSDGSTLVRRADLALYRAKGDGRGRARLFEAAFEDEAQQRRRIENDLRRAITERTLELHYQPIVALGSDRIVGAEALLRWTHPELGPIPPAAFIPIAEQSDLIVPIGECVLRRACLDAALFGGDIMIAVNLSPQQFKSPRLAAALVGALKESGLRPARLELEITESALIDSAAARDMIGQFKALGVGLALDDFGTGYSSLSYLRTYPFDKIKIDRSFVREAVDRPESAAIVEAVAALARRLGMTTTAEGIETERERSLALGAGCELGQGYLFGRPVPVETFAALLKAQRLAA